jgi:hypothetical protein
MRAAKIWRAKSLFRRIPGVPQRDPGIGLCLGKDSENEPFGSRRSRIPVGPGGIGAYFGKRSGPALGSWHQGSNSVAYFRDTTLRIPFIKGPGKFASGRPFINRVTPILFPACFTHLLGSASFIPCLTPAAQLTTYSRPLGSDAGAHFFRFPSGYFLEVIRQCAGQHPLTFPHGFFTTILPAAKKLPPGTVKFSTRP